MNEQANIQLVKKACSCFKTGDIKALLGLMSRDIQWELPAIENVPFSGKRQGVTGVGDFFDKLAEAQDVIEFNTNEFIGQGNKVVTLGNYKWRVKETGLPFNGDFAHVFTVENDKIVAFHEYMDTAAAATAFSKELAHH